MCIPVGIAPTSPCLFDGPAHNFSVVYPAQPAGKFILKKYFTFAVILYTLLTSYLDLRLFCRVESIFP
jgi:hypothetical protein